jgi:hypothetical protein
MKLNFCQNFLLDLLDLFFFKLKMTERQGIPLDNEKSFAPVDLKCPQQIDQTTTVSSYYY